MKPFQKSLTALATVAALASMGYAVAQTTQSTTNADGSVTTTQTITDTATQVVPAQDSGVIELNKPKGEVMPSNPQPNGPQGMSNSLMTTGMVDGYTRPSIGDHATPPIQPEPTTLSTTTERVVTTATPAPQPVAEAAPAPAQEAMADPEPMPAPRADRN